MTTAFFLLINRCGLSHREAAAFLDVRIDTIKSWSAGRNPAPSGAIFELRTLYAKIEDAASAILDQIRQAADANGSPDAVELGLASDDHEAQSLGWPCVGAQAAAFGIVVALTGINVIIVPRGSTPATAAAADRHERNNFENDLG